MSKLPLVTVVLVAWNSRADLSRCLPSLLAQDYPECEIIIVDNASTDGTAAWLRREFPELRLLANRENIGFAAAVNQAFELARGEVLVELNPDTTVEPDWLFPLVEAVQQPGVGLATARVMLMANPKLINACGNEMSLTGLTFCIGVGESEEQIIGDVKRMDSPAGLMGMPAHFIKSIPAISGAAFAMSRACYERIGCFDDDYFTYFEDTDLSWRARLAGFEVVLAAESVVYHDYQFRFSPRKMFWIERNRHLTLLKHLRWRTLLRLLAPLLLGEAIAWGYALRCGPATMVAKAQAVGWLLGNMGQVRRRRAAVQRLRQVEDDALVRLMTTTIRFDQTVQDPLAGWMSQLIEPLLVWWQRQIFNRSSLESRVG